MIHRGPYAPGQPSGGGLALARHSIMNHLERVHVITNARERSEMTDKALLAWMAERAMR